MGRGAPRFEALGDARHTLEGQRASRAMGESAAPAHLRDWRPMRRGPAEVCRSGCPLRSLTWRFARVLRTHRSNPKPDQEPEPFLCLALQDPWCTEVAPPRVTKLVSLQLQ